MGRRLLLILYQHTAIAKWHLLVLVVTGREYCKLAWVGLTILSITAVRQSWLQ